MSQVLKALLRGVVASAVTLGAAHAADFPVRRGGLWLMTMTSANGMSGKTKACVGPFLDRANGIVPHSADCNPPQAQGSPGGFSFHLLCHPSGGSTVETTGVASGDFQTAYTLKISTRVTPAPPNMPPMSMMVSAHYAGPCPAGMKPGDTRAN